MFYKNEKGQVLPFVAFMLAFLLPLMALVVDTGLYQYNVSKVKNTMYTSMYIAASTFDETDDFNQVLTQVTNLLLENDINPSDVTVNLYDGNKIEVIYDGQFQTIFAQVIGIDTIDIDYGLYSTIYDPTQGFPLVSVDEGLLPFMYVLKDYPENLGSVPEELADSCAYNGYLDGSFDAECYYSNSSGNIGSYFDDDDDSPLAKDLENLGLEFEGFEAVSNGNSGNISKYEIFIDEPHDDVEISQEILEMMWYYVLTEMLQIPGNSKIYPNNVELYIGEPDDKKPVSVFKTNLKDVVISGESEPIVFDELTGDSTNYLLDDDPEIDDLVNKLVPFVTTDNFITTLYHGTRTTISNDDLLDLYQPFNEDLGILGDYFTELQDSCTATFDASCSKRVINVPVVIPEPVDADPLAQFRVIGFGSFYIEAVHLVNGDFDSVDLTFTTDLAVGTEGDENTYDFGLYSENVEITEKGNILNNIIIQMK